MAFSTRIFFYIRQVEQLVNQHVEDVLKPHGVTPGQYMVLSLVGYHEPVSSAELARLVRKTAQYIGEYVKALESQGWIERRDDPKNRRIQRLSTSPEGRALLMRCEAAIDAAEREFLSCLAPEETATLRHALARLRNAAIQRGHSVA